MNGSPAATEPREEPKAAGKRIGLVTTATVYDATPAAFSMTALMRAVGFDDAVKVALEFQRPNPDTLLIVAADHETGGFSPTYAQKDLSRSGAPTGSGRP